jgi:tetratricopeptide (TPR) repeat protein
MTKAVRSTTRVSHEAVLVVLIACFSTTSFAQTVVPPAPSEDVEQFIEELTDPVPTVPPATTDPADPVDPVDPAPVKDDTRPVREPRGSPSSSTKIPAEPPRVAPTSDGIVAIKPLSYEGLVERYDMLQRARASGDEAQTKRATVLFEEGLIDLGLVGRAAMVEASDLALANLVVARSARENGRHDDADLAQGLALELAPALAAVHFEAVRDAIARLDPVMGIASLQKLFVGIVTRPETRVATTLIALIVLVTSLCVLLLVVALIGALRAFRYFAFDVHNVLPRGVARWQIAALLAVLLVLPLVAGLGPILTALVWMLVFGVYQDARQRAVYGGVLVVVITLPVLFDGISRLAEYPNSLVGRSHRALLDLHDDSGRDKLALEPRADLPVEGLAALAEDAMREGRIEEAKEIVRVIVSRANESAWAHNNLGVVAAVEGNLELADAAFKDALVRDPQLFDALFNRSLIAVRSGNKKTVDVGAEALAALDPELNERLRRLTFRGADEKVSQNRAYVLASVPTPAIGPALDSETDGSRARYDEIAAALLLGMPVRVGIAVFGVVFVLFMLLGRVGRSLQPSTPCTRCGAPSGRRYDGANVPSGTCSACFHAFVRKDGTLDAGMRVLKERQSVSFRRQTRVTTRIAAVVIPGGGHHFASAPVRATVGTLVVTSLAAVALFSPTLSLFWPTLLLDGMAPFRIAAGGLAALLHVVLVWDAFRISE